MVGAKGCEYTACLVVGFSLVFSLWAKGCCCVRFSVYETLVLVRCCFGLGSLHVGSPSEGTAKEERRKSEGTFVCLFLISLWRGAGGTPTLPLRRKPLPVTAMELMTTNVAIGMSSGVQRCREPSLCRGVGQPSRSPEGWQSVGWGRRGLRRVRALRFSH